MKEILIDTDTVSFFFRGHKSVVDKFSDYLEFQPHVSLSVITYYEVLNGLYYKDAKSQLRKFEQFTELCEILPLTSKIAQKAALISSTLRQKGVTIGHNDILIAATAMTHDLTLITNNVAHFGHIPLLDIDNWV